MRSRRQRLAFTLVELLVVMAILGLLMALLLPAVQTVREAARRSQCRNNLRQLGIALTSYTAMHDVFPAAAQGGSLSVYFNFTGYSQILPFLDQGVRYEGFNFDVSAGEFYGWARAENSTATTYQINLFLCPSNRTTRGIPVDVRIESIQPEINWSVPNMAVTDYVFNAGSHRSSEAAFTDINLRGPVYFNSSVRPSEIYDGPGKTFLMGEAAGSNRANRFRASGFGVNRRCISLNLPYQGSLPTYENLMYMGYGRPRPSDNGRVIIGGLVGVTVDYNGEFYPPNDCPYPSLTPASALPGAQQLPNFRSVHSGQIYFLLCDGSVQGIQDSIAELPYRALGSIAGGETDSYDFN